MAATPPGPEDPLDLSGPFVVPDDASALEADRLALMAELQQKARERATVQEPAKQHFWPYLLVFGATLIGLVGLIVVFLPQTGTAPAAVPLAVPTANMKTGAAGGLMPLGTVRVGFFDRTLRDFRPGVVAVVPAGSCATCEATIASVWEQEAAFGLPLLIVGQAGDQAALERLSADAGGSFVAYDNLHLLPPPTNAIRLYAIHADGVIEAVVAARPGTQLEPVLRNLGNPGAGQTKTP